MTYAVIIFVRLAIGTGGLSGRLLSMKFNPSTPTAASPVAGQGMPFMLETSWMEFTGRAGSPDDTEVSILSLGLAVNGLLGVWLDPG